jgi:hypothetical protein
MDCRVTPGNDAGKSVPRITGPGIGSAALEG